jgi:hypothetical protein
MDALIAKAMFDWIDDVKQLDALIVIANERYTALLNEIDRHRATFGQHLRRTIKQVEGADYHVIEGPKGDTKRDQSAQVAG